VKKQRQIGAKFIDNVLDLTTDSRFRGVLALFEKPAPSEEEILDGFYSIHALYVQTYPRSGLSQLDVTTGGYRYEHRAIVCRHRRSESSSDSLYL
jgi:hypothetical protein